MVKHTIVPPTYRFGDSRVEVLPYFLYEVCIYRLYKDRAELLDSRYYKSSNLLTIKNATMSKQYKDYSIVKMINLLGVTQDFVDKNHLLLYEATKPKRKSINKKKT
jgi:hypothetical protein